MPLAKPLEGVKVLDLSRVFAGPIAGRTLSDLGADVVKVEPPDGDVTRLWGRKAAGLSTYFTQQNCGKRNVCIDLQAGDGYDRHQRVFEGVAKVHGAIGESTRSSKLDVVGA